MSESTETEINLKTLRRVDPSIIEIIDNASQVALYKYERGLEKWEGTNIEGTLFLYQRSMDPYHGFIIVNRMSTTNFVEPITSNMQLQTQEPYLLYKNRKGDIIGTWFYERKDLWRISKQIQMAVLKQSSMPRRQRSASESETLSKNNVQVKTHMLTKAQKEYIKNTSSIKTLKSINNENSHYEFKKLVKTSGEDKPGFTNYSTFQEISSPRECFLSNGYFKQAMSSDSHPPDVKSLVHPLNNILEETNSRKKIWNEDVHGVTCLCHKEAITSVSDAISPDDSRRVLQKEEFLNQPKLHHKEMKTFDVKDWQAFESSSLHSASIKQVLKYHIEDNTKTLLKLHEAYIVGLRSLFIKN